MKKSLLSLAALLLMAQTLCAQYSVLHTFTGTEGAYPNGSLISDGTYLYGMTNGDNTTGAGTVFKMSIANGTTTVLHQFNYSDGANPYGSLISDGTYLYGMTSFDVANGGGTIFKTSIADGSTTVLHSFSGTEGQYPYGSLISDGTYLYGTTSDGGANSKGVAFKTAIADGTTTILHSFTGTDGAEPQGSLISDGTYFYGTTYEGGANNFGTVFKMSIADGTTTVLHSFTGTDGKNLTGSLISDGTYLYGMAYGGGANGKGVIFKTTIANGVTTVLHNFTGSSTDGATPNGSLISDGAYLYGMAAYGGAYNDGTIFKTAIIDGSTTDLYDFNGATDGANPGGDLLRIGNSLYGMTGEGGANNDGTVFQFADAALPVALERFSGTLQHGIAGLYWNTGVESNFNHFEIQKSTDGKGYNFLTSISAKGSNSSYTYNTPQTEAMAYYRLKMIDNDSKSAYSSVMTLSQSENGNIIIYPNPAVDHININVIKAGSINIYDALGKLIKTETVEPGLNKIDISILHAGVYFVETNSMKAKFIKN